MSRSSRVLIALMVGAGLAAGGLLAAQPELPVAVPDATWRPLDAGSHPGLQRALTRRVLASERRRKLVDQRRLAVGLVDLSDPARPRFAQINGDEMMYAASLPKIALLLAAHQAIEDGSLADDRALRHDMTAMIRKSSNAAATAVLDRLGYEKVAATLTDPRLELYDPDRGGGLWVGKRYARSGRRFPDPIKGLSHAATATQVCRFYYLLATGRAISRARSSQMLAHLVDPGLHHAFVGVLDHLAPKARVYRKSGSWSIWYSDSVLVWGPGWRRYILVGLVESAEGRGILCSLVPLAEEALRDPEGGGR